MADSRETGLRVGAGYNQAAMVASQLAGSALLAEADIPDFIEGLAQKLITSANDTQGALLIEAGFPNTVVADAPAPAPTKYTTKPTYTKKAAAPATNGYNYDTTFSGSARPLKLSEHPELEDWLRAQAAAVYVYEVWDNRGKPNYVDAIASGAVKTPPPFRSATEGVDKSFWPPD